MVENKNNLIGKIAKAGFIGGLSLLPVLSNGQKVAKPVEKINWTKQQNIPYAKYILLINSKNALPELSRYKSGIPNEYLSNGGNLNLYSNHYEIPQDQIQGPIADYLRKIDVCPDCTKCKTPLKHKSNLHTKPKPKPVPKKPITPPTKPVLTQKKPVTTVPKYDSKKQEEEKSGISYSIETNTTNNVTNNTTNNYYITPEEVKKSNDIHKDTLKKSSLEFRTLIEGSKTVNPLKSPFWQASINPQIGRDWLWFGPYATVGFGSENNSTETPVYKKILLSQAAQIFTETDGKREGNSKSKYSMGYGGTLSLNTNDNKVRFDLSYGLVNRKTSTSGISESGYDRKLVGNKVIEEKPYGPINIEEGEKYENWVPTQGIGIAIQPSQKVPIFIKAKAEHIGKISDKKGPVNFNVAIGGNIGWRKK